MKLLLLFILIWGPCTVLATGHNEAWERLHREPPLGGAIAPTNVSSVQTKWIRQKVDNFDPQNPSTWSMRYMENREHYRPGGPLFVMVGGEWTISAVSISSGHFYDMAKSLGAYLCYTEHRYYGLSRPTVNTRTDSLKFLNIDQALADLAHFVEEIKSSIEGASNASVIMAGGSYSATMVTWFRQKYPHLIDGAWASSAPLLAKLDFVEYYEVVSDSIRLVGGDACAERIGRAFNQTESLLDREEFDRVREEFMLCDNIDFSNTLDRRIFFWSISLYMALVVQYHWPGDIEAMCDIVNDESVDSDMAALAKWHTRDVSLCIDSTYASFIQFYRNTSWNHGANEHAICAEYGWHQTSGSVNQIFGSSFPVDLFLQMCKDLYNGIFSTIQMEAHIARTNTIYGHMNPAVTNVFFTQGQIDPWRPPGIQEDLNEFSPAVVIPLASHCADRGSITDSDSPEMRAAKERIFELIQTWIAH
ncbi:putative serine protease K12H4.7 isoform X2 [Wyeomyia smithii]|uniref:putative serine protease K12H4.7 isoform X2 n=1 Tax=Wyeomyia smithii TaxID=174621 RepID=UPI0024681955|nr:putative serine protease K12H4.7 isoform X2 [Wyeomyia smithii]